jgi:hypothetical protein
MMFSMTLVFGASQIPWVLLFKTEESFQQAKNRYVLHPQHYDMQGKAAGDFECTDDFGSTVHIKRENIWGVLFEDLDKTKQSAIARGIHNIKTQIDADAAGMADPKIAEHMRKMRMAQGGPAVLSPSFNGQFRN